VVPEYGPRVAQPSKLDAFKPCLEEAAARRGVERARATARTVGTELHAQLHDSDGLVATATQRRMRCGSATLRDSSVPKCPQSTCACLATQSRRAYFFSNISQNSVMVPGPCPA
jgi:hypothetical protein